MPSAKKSAGISILLLAITVVLAAFFVGCAGPQPKQEDPQQARCNVTPQWNTKDKNGNHVGIYVCFGEKNQLLYSAKIISAPLPKPTLVDPKEK